MRWYIKNIRGSTRHYHWRHVSRTYGQWEWIPRAEQRKSDSLEYSLIDEKGASGDLNCDVIRWETESKWAPTFNFVTSTDERPCHAWGTDWRQEGSQGGVHSTSWRIQSIQGAADCTAVIILSAVAIAFYLSRFNNQFRNTIKRKLDPMHFTCSNCGFVIKKFQHPARRWLQNLEFSEKRKDLQKNPVSDLVFLVFCLFNF